jgi:hypothetical protein
MPECRISVHITVHRAWWLSLYLRGVVLLAVLKGREPNYDKVARVIRRGLSTSIEGLR